MGLGARVRHSPMLADTSTVGAAPSSDTEGCRVTRKKETTITDTTTQAAIRPFSFTASDEALAHLRRRVAATDWPDKELVADDSQGVQFATLQALAQYWASEHDWRKLEGRLNAFPQFLTPIDGVDIHFIHVRSKEPNALPVIVTHGWPG